MNEYGYGIHYDASGLMAHRHLPGQHDQKTHGHGHGAGKSATVGGKMSDEEFEARQAYVEKTMDASAQHATDVTHATTDAEGNLHWDPERDRLHREIADELYRKAAAGVPSDGEAIIAGGLGGAGKSSVLKKHAGIDQSKYVTLNPDDVKELMAARGLIPEVPGHPSLSPMERVALVHEESTRISMMMAGKAYVEKKNVIWDITMSSEKSVAKRIKAMRVAGYSRVDAVFVDIPTEVSVSRAMRRYRTGQERYMAGDGMGGRFVPPWIIRKQRTSSGTTVNRQVFDRLKTGFDSWSMYDNSVDGRAPQLVSKG